MKRFSGLCFSILALNIFTLGTPGSVEPGQRDHFSLVTDILPLDDELNRRLKEEFLREHRDDVGVFSVTVPAYSSRPNAPRTLYLDFDGEAATTWGSYSQPVLPAYSSDNNPNSFSTAELNRIHEIWQRVSECYSPFDINVTTASAPSLAPGVAVKVIIGGNDNWMIEQEDVWRPQSAPHGHRGGIAYLGIFNHAFPYRWGYAFTDLLGGGHPKYTADAVCHEAGHMFGLDHQSSYSTSNPSSRVTYNPGANGKAPIMGNSYSAGRALWWNGTTSSPTTTVRDTNTLTNILAVSPDEAPSGTTDTPVVSTSGNSFSVSGVVQTLSDQDTYRLTLPDGVITVQASPFTLNPMLKAALEILDTNGTSLALSAPASSQSPSASLRVSSGTYFIRVFSQAVDAGDIGSYTISGSIAPDAVTVVPTPAQPDDESGDPQPTATPVATATPLPTAQPPAATPTPVATKVPTVKPTVEKPVVIPTKPSLPAVTIEKPKNKSIVRTRTAAVSVNLGPSVTKLIIALKGLSKTVNTNSRRFIRQSVPLRHSSNSVKVTAFEGMKAIGAASITVYRKQR